MAIENQILFFLAGLGVFNGLLLTAYFLFGVKPKKWINLLFGLLLLMLCIRIGKSLFHAFTDVSRIYRQLGLSACTMIGPLLYLYVRAFLAKAEKPKHAEYLHLLLPLLLIIVIGITWPYETHPDAWNDQIIHIIYGIWIVYMIATYRSIGPIAKNAFQQKPTIAEVWLLLLYACILLLCVAYNLALYNFPYLAGPILFSIVLYVLLAFLASKKRRSIVLQETTDKYQHQKIRPEKADELLQGLDDLMQNQQLYLHPKIKLAQVADAMDSSPHELSQVINDRLGISFNHYINQYRVRAACSMLRDNDHLSIEGIGQEVGFHSRSSFYTAFKTVTQQTPAQYKATLKES